MLIVEYVHHNGHQQPPQILSNGHRFSYYLQLRSVRGQLASSTTACTTAEGRSRQLSSQVSEKIAELAQLREEAEKANSSYRMVCRKSTFMWLSAYFFHMESSQEAAESMPV